MIKNGVWMSAQEAFQPTLIITTKQCLNTIRIELMGFTQTVPEFSQIGYFIPNLEEKQCRSSVFTFQTVQNPKEDTK